MAEMTLQQAFERAVRHHQSGELAQAEVLYQFVLTEEPDEPAVLHLLGLIKASGGQADAALALIRRAIEILPDVAEFHVNLAAILQSLGRSDEAIDGYRKAIALNPESADAHFSLGVTLQSLGRAEEAEAAYKRSIELKPDFGPAHNNLGTIYSTRGEFELAERWFRSALALNPNHASAQSNLAGVLASLGRMPEAAAAYRRSIALTPESADEYLSLGHVLQSLGEFQQAAESIRECLALAPRHPKAKQSLTGALWSMGRLQEAIDVASEAVAEAPESMEAHYALAVALERGGRKAEALEAFKRAARLHPDPQRVQFDIAALGEGDSPPTAPADYVVAIFNDFATRFDKHMIEGLKYDAPRQLFEALRPFLGGDPLDIADLGCGTGLSGVPFRAVAKRLVGVDLAPRMIAASKQRGIYDKLHVGDVTAFLEERPGEFDVIVAADLFIYVGDLGRIVPAAGRALRDGGWLVFSVEAQEGPGFRLQATRRYSHSLEYLRGLARESGFEVKAAHAVTLRLENGKPMGGYAVVMGRGGGSEAVTR